MPQPTPPPSIADVTQMIRDLLGSPVSGATPFLRSTAAAVINLIERRAAGQPEILAILADSRKAFGITVEQQP